MKNNNAEINEEELSEEQQTEELTRIADRSAKKTFFKKRKGCPICLDKKEVDYKDPDLLSKFTSVSGRILPVRITGVCASHQRQLKKAIKLCRMLAIMPF